MTRLVPAIAVLALAGTAAFWWLTRPQAWTALPTEWVDYRGDPANGERLFHAAGCGNCHVSGEDGDSGELGGGLELSSPAGVFRAPNISPDPGHGIGAWSALDFVNAVKHGVAPDGRHYYPAFPYPSYARMNTADVLDIKAWIDTLPPVAQESPANDLAFPWNLRRGIGLWKRLAMDTRPVIEATDDEAVLRGRYLVEGPGHCGECHTPRNRLMVTDRARWLGGAPDLEGEGSVPNLTPHGDGLGGWSADDIEYYLESGVDPDFDVVGGSMVAVQENLARLPAADRAAIAAYLKAVPPVADRP